jgi:putative hemolysin
MGIDFVKAGIEDWNIKLNIKGESNIPREGKYVFAANHPLGGFDGLILMKVLHDREFEVKFLVNDILMNIKNLHPLFIPINKHGGHPKEIVKKMDEAFHSNAQILTFPSGFVSRKINGKITDLKWQKSFIVKAKQYQRDIVPVHFSGKNSNFFYNLGNMRKFFGIKANLEMFYLVDETYHHRDKTITVSFGKPVPFKTFDNRFSAAEWANKMKEHVYHIEHDVHSSFIV